MTTLTNDYDYLLDHHREELDRGRENARNYGALLADWQGLRVDLQRAYDELHEHAVLLAQRNHVEASRVRDTASGVLQAIHRMDNRAARR